MSDMRNSQQEELRKIEAALTTQEQLRGILPDEQLESTLATLREKRHTLLSQLQGSGAIAQGKDSTALGEAAQQINAPVQGDVMGAGAKKEVLAIYVQDQSARTHEALRSAYLGRIFETTRHLSLAGVDPKAASNEVTARLNLSEVYTALLTTSDRLTEIEDYSDVSRRKKRRVSALEALNAESRLVLLGDPGSGKSTFINFVAMCLAGAALRRQDANLAILTTPLPTKQGKAGKKPQPWDHGALLPIPIILRDFVAHELSDPSERATAEHLWRFISKELEVAAIGDYAPYLYQELLERECLLLLDGLDEVPEANCRRIQIRQVVEDFASTFHKCRIIVTSRTYAYQKQDWRLSDFAETALAPFSKGQVLNFIDRWYTHIAHLRGINPTDAQGRAETLKGAIYGSQRLQDLARRPLLLTLMASLHAWRGGSLPEKREELYADAVDLLLDWWESPKVVRDSQGKAVVLQPSLAEWLKVDRDKVRDLLNELAHRAHISQPDLVGTADVHEDKLVGGLMRLSQNPDVNPVRLVEYLSQRAGLLVPKGVGIYTFPHRTFQEYLAACYLTDHGYPDDLVELACTDPDRWREVLLLAGAKAARGSTYAFWALVDALCHHNPEDADISLGHVWGAHLAGQLLTETADLKRVGERDKAKVDLVREWHLRLIRSDELPASERALAGENLERLGDSRFRTDVWSLPNEPLLGFVEIQQGEFLMGSTKGQATEYPEHIVPLPTFYLCRHLVTVAQFCAFVEDSGYQPAHRESLVGLGNHPVRWITWFDALAYCNWLTERLREWPSTPKLLIRLLVEQGWSITLPSEAEWEKAARGGILIPSNLADQLPNPFPSRTYPWGDSFDPNKANTINAGIRAVSPVGCFHQGASPYGLLDMSGNLWEWTRSQFKEYPYDAGDGREDLTVSDDVRHVLRGGTFGTDWKAARCSSRVEGNVRVGSKSRGFRLAISLI